MARTEPRGAGAAGGGEPARSPTAGDAAVALARLGEMAADLRGCALLDASGEVLAASGDADAWGEAARGFLAAADGAGDEPAAGAHVATEEGEAFALRRGELALVAVTDRFTLASLMLLDMRTVLRDLANGEAGRDRQAPRPVPARE